MVTISQKETNDEYDYQTGRWLAGKVVGDVGIYGTKAAKGFFSVQRRSSKYLFAPSITFLPNINLPTCMVSEYVIPEETMLMATALHDIGILVYSDDPHTN